MEKKLRPKFIHNLELSPQRLSEHEKISSEKLRKFGARQRGGKHVFITLACSKDRAPEMGLAVEIGLSQKEKIKK